MTEIFTESNSTFNLLKVLVLVGDLTVEKDCEEAVQNTIERFKRLDVLIPNAGILKIGYLETHSLAEYDQVMDINCRSVIVLTKLCIPHLTESKGNIVNVSSICGLRAVR